MAGYTIVGLVAGYASAGTLMLLGGLLLVASSGGVACVLGRGRAGAKRKLVT